jgi:choline dehydrogenase
MNDHCVHSIMAQVQESASVTQMFRNASTLAAAEEQFLIDGTGPYSAPSGITNCFQHLEEDTLRAIGAGAVVDAGLANQSHVEFLYESSFYPGGLVPLPGQPGEFYYTPQANLSYISITCSPLMAQSRGNVTLRSSSMFDAPNINPNYYSNETDRAVAINCFKDLRKMFAVPAVSALTVGPNNGEVQPGFQNVPANASDDVIFEYIKRSTIPNWHASATCQMAPQQAGGVVDPRLRVYGVQGLRIADVSVLPSFRIPDVNLVGPVYMIAERAAAIIKEDYGLTTCSANLTAGLG